MSHMYPPPGEHYPHPGQPDQFGAQRFFDANRMPQSEQERLAGQPGGIGAAYDRQAAEHIYAQESARRAHDTANSPQASTTSYQASPVYRPQPAAQPRYAGTTTPTFVAVPPKSRAVLALVIVLLLLAGLVGAGYAVYRHATKEVTLAAMGIQDHSKASWSWNNGTAVEYGFHVVTFSINTTNNSDQVRKVRFCARKESGTTDNCFHYKVGPRSAAKFEFTINHAQFGLDDRNNAGPNARIVEIDGFHIRA